VQRTTFDDGFDWLEKFFKSSQSKERRDHFFERFKTDDDDLFCAAVHTWCNKGKSFPSPDELNGLITDAREFHYDREKQKELSNRKPLSNPDRRNTERGRRWLQGILEVCEGKITADGLIARMGEDNDQR
jgi:hypothetical protein